MRPSVTGTLPMKSRRPYRTLSSKRQILSSPSATGTARQESASRPLNSEA